MIRATIAALAVAASPALACDEEREAATSWLATATCGEVRDNLRHPYAEVPGSVEHHRKQAMLTVLAGTATATGQRGDEVAAKTLAWCAAARDRKFSEAIRSFY